MSHVLPDPARRLRRIKQAIWVYLVLLIFEGALRKWVLPGLATPLLVIRDPVALFILFEAARRGVLPRHPVLLASVFIGLVAVMTAVLFGHGNPLVAFYGARSLLLYFPAMFVMARVLERQDLLRMGRFILWLAVPMTALIGWQFYSPQSAWVNVGVGGVGSAGFIGTGEYFRPPGTFSFTTGVAQFYALAVAVLLYAWLQPAGVSTRLRVLATMAVVLAIPFALSRTLIFQTVLTLLFAAMASASRPRLLRKGVLVMMVGGVAVLAASQFGFFQEAFGAVLTRFDQAGKSEGGIEGTLVTRYLGGLWQAFTGAGDYPFWGMGIGMGSNAGSMLMTGGKTFLIAEDERQRLVGELGLLLGFVLIGLRVGVTAVAGLKSVVALRRGDVLPWMLLVNAATLLPQGNWAQPTSLGFSVIAGALLLASLRKPAPARAPAAMRSGGTQGARVQGARTHG